MDITHIIGAVITLIVFAVGALLLPLIRQKIGDGNTMELLRWVDIFVRAAEQIFRESGMGAKKKDYVLERLKEKGYIIDLEAVEDMIEAAVLELNRGGWQYDRTGTEK